MLLETTVFFMLFLLFLSLCQLYVPMYMSNSMQEKKKDRRKLPMTKGEVEIRQQMTVEELARAMGKDVGESFSVVQDKCNCGVSIGCTTFMNGEVKDILRWC